MGKKIRRHMKRAKPTPKEPPVVKVELPAHVAESLYAQLAAWVRRVTTKGKA